MDDVICDFCSDVRVAWSYPANDVVIYAPVEDVCLGTSVGPWAACDACHTLIEAEDKNGLTLRTAMTNPLLAHLGLTRVVEITQAIHAGFYAARTGPAVPCWKES